MTDNDDFEPNLNARNTDPGTSHAAADASEAKKLDEAQVYAMFVEVGEQGLTDYELCAAMHSRHGEAWEAEGKSRKRRCDLHRDGHLDAAIDWATDKILTRRSPGSGKGRIVWVLSAAAMERRRQAEAKLLKPEQLSLL